MCMGDPEALDDLIKVLEKAHGNEAHFYRSKDTYLEISAKNIKNDYIFRNDSI